MDQQNENTEFKEFLEKYKEHWDKFFEEWSKGESHQKKLLKNDKIWSDENRKGKVWKTKDGKEKSTLLEYDVLPQPYLGNIENHSVITLNLNPSRSKKNNENIEFEKNYLPKFKEAENYHEYAERFPTYDTHPFWQKQDDWIDRIFEKLDKHLQKTQYGFRTNKSTANAIFLIRRIIDTAERSNKQRIHMLLLDWEKAFDKPTHKAAFIAIEKINIDKQIVNLMKMAYKDSEFMVETNGIESNRENKQQE